MEVEAGALDAMGDRFTAERRRSRARALRDAATALWGTFTGPDESAETS